MILDKIFKKKQAPNWNSLSDEQKSNVTRKIVKGVKAMSGPRYRIVSGMDEFLREHGRTETRGEDFYLDNGKRGRMLDLARNLCRNSPTFNAIMKQIDLNVVGSKGGKVILNIEDEELARKIKTEFAKWTRTADFFDGMSFNSLLQVLLKTYIVNGDMVLLFDDGLIADSGKIVCYEGDEIGSVTEDALARHFGKSATQSNGRVYDQYGRSIGCIVSRSQRGQSVFQEDHCYFLKQDPDGDYFDNRWLMPRNVFRFAQGRGLPVCASAIANSTDLEDLMGFELQAAKKNSQCIAQILQNSTPEEAVIPSSFDSDTDFSSMTDDEIKQAVEAEKGIQDEQVVTLDKIKAAGVVYNVMPENTKIELLDTKHPNQAMPEFIKFLCSRSSATFGLSEQYATLVADESSFRAQQLMSKPAFQSMQKFLESICDWVFERWLRYASKKGIVDTSKLPEDYQSYVDWSWPDIDELDENAHQDAVEKKLRNLTGTYAEELGPDWKAKLIQVKAEIEFCKQNGLAHPSFGMISGGERSESETAHELYTGEDK